MDTKRKYNLRVQFLGNLTGLYSWSRAFKPLAMDMHDKYTEFLKKYEKLKLPRDAIAFVEGYKAALDDDLYRNSLVFGGTIDGVFYSTYRMRDDYYCKHGIEPSEFADKGKVKNLGHYWADDTSKPYFISELHSIKK